MKKKIPYVVSADIYLLLQQWAKRHSWSKLPPPEFFADLRRKFANYMRQIFPVFEMVPEGELQQGIQKLTITSASRTSIHSASRRSGLPSRRVVR